MPDLVYDQAENPPRVRRPGERVDTPASWPSLHKATLRYLIGNVVGYFRVLHNSKNQRRNLLRFITELLDIIPFQPATGSSATTPIIPLQSGHDDLPPHIFEHAVTALVNSLRSSPFAIRHVHNPLLHTLCERYYSPIFGRSLDGYREEVYTSLIIRKHVNGRGFVRLLCTINSWRF
jgi:hypothetical protein